MTNFNLVRPTRAATAGSHFQHIPDGDAAQNRPVRSLQRIVRKVPGRSLFGHVYVINDHNDHADRAYWQCYRQGHFPGDPCRVITARRHFWRDVSNYYLYVENTASCLNDAVCHTSLCQRYSTRDTHTPGCVPRTVSQGSRANYTDVQKCLKCSCII